jgi:DNA-directed RNA polymerase subunit RPC12/RpoP
MTQKCPGQDDRNLKSENLTCPACGYRIEIFSDEIMVRCPKCKEQACRNRLPSCVDWCKAARECIGEDKWRQLMGSRLKT